MMFRLIVAVLAAGLGFWAILQAFSPDSAPQTLSSLPVIDQAQVTQVDIIAPVGQQSLIHLERVSEVWMFEGKTANQQAVKRLIRDLSTMQAIRLLSQNPELYEKFHLDDRATRVIFQNRSKQTLLDVFIGKQGTDLISTYIRLAGKPDALAVDKTLLWQVRRTPEAWLSDL